jgi:hypothetical protein
MVAIPFEQKIAGSLVAQQLNHRIRFHRDGGMPSAIGME